MPLLHNIVHQRSAQRRVRKRIGRKRIEPFQLENFLGVELIRIAQQAVERGGAYPDLAQLRRRVWRRSLVRLGWRHFAIQLGKDCGYRSFGVGFHLFAQQRLCPQQKARGDGRPVLVALRAAQYDLGRAHCSCQIMGGKADTELGSRYAHRP